MIWICDNQRPKLDKNQKCKSFIPYYLTKNMGTLNKKYGNKYLTLVPTDESKENL